MSLAQADDAAVITVTPNPAVDWTLDIPGFTPGAVNRVHAERTEPGGKGITVAAFLAGAGIDVAAAGFLGETNATSFERFFRERRIRDLCVRVPGATRTGIKIVDASAAQTTDINFPGAPVRAADLETLHSRLEAVADTGRWFVLAGSLPPGVPVDYYRKTTSWLRDRGCRVALDASGEALREGVRAAPDVVKPNLHELEELVGRKLASHVAVVDAARALCHDGVGLAVVSMGAEGALFVTAEQTLFAQPPRFEVGSTVGAGDAMVAGIVTGMLRGLDLNETARLATAFSAHRLTHGLPDSEFNADLQTPKEIAVTSCDF